MRGELHQRRMVSAEKWLYSLKLELLPTHESTKRARSISQLLRNSGQCEATLRDKTRDEHAGKRDSTFERRMFVRGRKQFVQGRKKRRDGEIAVHDGRYVGEEAQSFIQPISLRYRAAERPIGIVKASANIDVITVVRKRSRRSTEVWGVVWLKKPNAPRAEIVTSPANNARARTVQSKNKGFPRTLTKGAFREFFSSVVAGIVTGTVEVGPKGSTENPVLPRPCDSVVTAVRRAMGKTGGENQTQSSIAVSQRFQAPSICLKISFFPAVALKTVFSISLKKASVLPV